MTSMTREFAVGNAPPDPAAVGQAPLDPRLALLARAAARYDLVAAGALELEEALNPLAEPFMAIVAPDRDRRGAREKGCDDGRPDPQ
jgi:hypothetical protein